MIVFLDRDGIINKDRKDYVRNWKEFEFIPGIIKEIKLLNQNGYEVIIITNQSCIAKGLLTEESLKIIHQKMIGEIYQNGGKIKDIFYCPHHPEGIIKRYKKICNCRKPKPGLIFRAAEKYNIDLAKSWMIGDSPRDVEAGRSAGCKTILVEKDMGIEIAIKDFILT